MPLLQLPYGKVKEYWGWFETVFPQTSTLAADLPAWESFWEVRDTGSRTEWMAYQGGSGQHLLDARQRQGPDAYLLHGDLLQKLNLKAGQKPPGIAAGQVGPGAAYQLWKQTADELKKSAAP
jgi:hypothetical protein